MSEELPKRIFNEGDEPQVTQINNNCRIDYIIKKFEKWMPKEFADVKKDPVFSQVFKLHENGLGYSARVIHSILCRELLTYMMHELWFVFARRPHRFSLQEFHAVTGFECRTSLSLKIDLEDYAYDGGFWSKVLKRKDESITLFNLWNKDKAAVMKWKNADRIRLIYLAIILCVVLARDEKANIPLKYITLVMDLEKFRKYPWGVAAYDLLCSSIAKNRHKLKEKTTSYVLDGFSYALQIWAMEAVPKIGKLCGKKLDKSFANGPRCINWRGAAKVSYDEINRLEQIFTAEDVSYPYISWAGNMVVIQSQEFRRDDDVEDDRINVVMELIRAKHDFSEHIWEFEETEVSLDLNDEAPANVEAAESEEEFETPQGSNNLSSTSRRGKKRVPDRGMEKRKHKVLSSAPKQAPFNEDMKAFVTQLFEDNFSAMEKRLQKQMSETFEQMKSDLIASRKEASVEVEHGGPSPSKATTSQPPLRRSTRGMVSVSVCVIVLYDIGLDFVVFYKEAVASPVKFSQDDDIFRGIGTQGVENLSQASHVPEVDPSQTDKEEDWWTPMTTARGSRAKDKTPPPSQWKKWSKGNGKGPQLSDTPLPQDDSPESQLYYFSEESWDRFTQWSMNPIPLQIGPTIFNSTVATRIVCAGKWLGNDEMDAYMFIWRVNTSLGRWGPTRVAFMSAIFNLQLNAAYNVFHPDKKSYQLPEFLLGYGRGELPSHGRTDLVWGVDIDRLYFPLFVNGNHWIAVTVNIIERKVEAFDCGGRRNKNRQSLEKFAHMIPRIVKAVAPPDRQKKLLLSPYTIVEVPMKKRLNKSCCDCGVYALKHLECLLLGVDISLVDDEIIQGCRQKIGVELWEATQDPIFADAMTRYVPSPWERSEVFDLEED
ncbi:uncharacterized protein LOC108836937 [Raphanus sativus]|uniref:Uncharacterized protein LOC108836937 n=1 Tax=Raphanus sativus TaxID=3726 RepID=A0A9W3CBH6_RAPSA|nr:uncharacterized protein LOC108836937 [Raphanus sativus]